MQCYWPIAEPLIGTATVDSTKLNQWQQLTWRNVRSSWSTGTAQAFRFDFEGMASGKIAYIDDVMLIDLTAAFGSGNEPTQDWCKENIEYFAGNTTIQYETPTVYDLTSTTPTKIKTGDILNCPYSGSAKQITLPPGKYKLECWGAQGGNGANSSSGFDNISGAAGGKGGYSIGTLNILKKTIIYLYTGGKGGCISKSANDYTGGFNGGGTGGVSGTMSRSGGGGGASDIRINQDSLYARIIVAGGGGATSWGPTSETGDAGGGTSSAAGTNSPGLSTQNSGNTFGIGGNCYTSGSSSNINGAGGGGWYGGKVSTSSYAGGSKCHGGGGSGYVYTSSTASSYPSGCLLNSSYYLTEAQTIAGNTSFVSPTGTAETGHTGNGYVRITVIKASSGNTLVKIPQTLPSTYVPIEYLQFTGTQYIDTGAIVDSNTGFDITFEVLNGQSGSPYYNLFGVRGNDSSGGTGETQNFFRIDTIAVDSNSGTEFKYGSTVYNSGIKNTSKINIKLVNKVYTKPDGSTIILSGNITTGLPMYIGCINKNNTAYGNKASMKVYRFKIYNGSTLAHNFIPVQRVSDKVLGLYDLKTSTFKTNLGSGVFTSNLMNDPSSLAYFNGDSLQSQGNLSLTITNNNVTLSNEQTHFGKNSLKFDGSSSYMYMPFPSTYTGDITIEGWFYQTSNNNNTYPTPFTLISSAGRGMYMHRLSSQTFVAATPSNSWPGLGGGTPALNTWTHIAMCLSGTTTYCFLDGKLKGTITNTNTSYVGLTLGTLAESASSNHQSGCYYKGYIAELKVSKGCKWTKDFTLPAAPYSTAKDFNPWKEPVQMFVNTGISTTIPSGLVELEYIESTGTQYIDTGFKPNNNTRVVMDLQLLSTSGIPYVFGTWAGGMNNCFSVYWWTNVHNSWGVDYGTQRSAIPQTNWNKRLIVDLNQNVVTVDSVSYTLTATTFTATNNLFLLALNNGKNALDYTVAKVYRCKIYDNGMLVRDFIPCKNASGVIGLWDDVNSVFYQNAGTGTFTAGPAVNLTGWHKIKGIWAKTAADTWSQAL